MSERELQSAVLDLAKRTGWTRAHFRPAYYRDRPITAQTGEPGFPDLILMRPPRLIAAELKAQHRKLSPEQLTWIEGLDACGVEAFVWRPEQWHSGAIERLLK